MASSSASGAGNENTVTAVESGENAGNNDPRTVPRRDESIAAPFEWLSRAQQESTYVCYGDLADNTATAFEFGGGNGYTGCVNCGGELLQITAPSKRHGIIFARGRFEYSLYSSLARGQRWPGGKSTFGVQFPFHKTTQRSGRMTWPRIAVCKELIQQGSFNHRWPVQKYPLCLETFDASSGESGTPNVKHGIGTCSVVSYVDDDRFVYQVLRFDLDNPDEIPDGTKIVLRIGGSINFRSFLEKDKPPTMAAGKMTAGDRVPARRLASQVTGPGIETATSSQQKAREPPTSDTAVYTWAADPSVRLAARLYLVEWADPAKDRGPAMPLELVCQPGKRSVLKDDTKNPPGYSYRASINVTKAHGKDKAQGSFTVAAVFALFETSSGISWPTTLKSPSSMSSSMGTVADEKRETTTNRAPGDGLLISDQEVYDYLGVNSRSERATGAMWETAFLEKGEDSYAISELSEVSLVGRCLEKTLMVDLIPASTQDPQNPNAPQPMALMSNLFVQANLDLKAVFWKTRFLVKVRALLLFIAEHQDEVLRRINGDKPDGKEKQQEHQTSMGKRPHGARLPAFGDISPVARDNRTRKHYMSELKMVRYQLLRVESAIKSIVQYLIDALVKPSSKDTETRMIHLLPDNHIRGESNYYYVMTTIWYVITNYPEHALPWKVQQRGADLNAPFDIPWLDDVQHWKGTGLMDGDNRLPDDNYVFDKTIKIKAALLKWFHYGSVLNLIKFGAIPCAWAPKPRRGMDFEDTVRQLERKAKIALATQVATQPDYSERDEIVDRLAFVAGELQLDTDRQIWSRLGAPRWVNRRIDISDMASKRIMARDYSRELNPGLSSPDYDGVTSGPWEIHALCHHSRLLVVNQKYSEVAAHPIEREMNHVKMRAELEKFRGKLRWFLASDATLVPCWDRSSLVARRGWLRSEATSVLATTLIDICLKDLDRTFEAQIAQLRHRAESRIRGESPAINRRSTRPMSVNFQESDTSINTKLLNEFLDRKVVELDRGGSSSTPAIDWMAFKPPRRYHPDEFFTSLDDTDNLYKRKNIEAIDLPSGLRDFFNNQAWRSWHGPTSGGAGRVDTGPPGNHEGSASRGLPVQTGLSPSARASNLCGSHNAAADEHSAGEQHLEPLPDGRQKGSGAVYPDYNEFRDIINRGENLAFMSVVDLVSPDTAQVSDAIPLEPRIACTIKDRTAENSDEESEIKKLKKMLSDSLIDQGVQHRFIALTGVPTLLASLDPDPPGTTVGGQPQSFSKEMARNQLKLLAYVLHTESMDCLNSHLLRTSEFSCHKGNRWAARITVRSWKKEYIGPRTSRKSGARGHDVDQSRPNGLDENDPNLLAMEDLPIEMPEFLEDWLRENDFKARDEAYSHAVELKVSSIILSSNAFGDFTKGTIISQIIPKEDLLTLASHSLKLWQQFTHQPQTARCLVFLMILSFLCRSISRDTRDAVDYFAKPLELEKSFIRSQEDWVYDGRKGQQKSDQIHRLRLGLFCLEALFKLRNTLAGSIIRIEEARTTLLAQIAHGPGRRSAALERMCQEYLEHLERTMAELNAISMRLERKVELHSRYRDSLSTVLALRDSQNSLEQNKTSINQNRTIERLTTLTIGYLPLGLTAAIFAIPEEQFVISKGTGRGWFVGIILILFAATVLVASAIEALKKGYHFCTGWVAWFFHKVHDLVWHAVENYLLIRRPEGGFLRWLFGTVLHIHRAPSPYGDAFGGEPYRDKKTGKGKEKGEKIGKDKVPKHSRWQERNAGEAPARDAGGSNGHALVSGPSGKPDTDLWKRIVESNQRTEVGEAEHGFEQSAVSPLKRLWDVVTCGRREPHEPPGDVEIGGNPKRRNQDPVGR